MKNSTRFEVFRRDRFKCQYCGAQIQDTELHVDHVIPRKLGGTDDPFNLVTACTACNLGKGSRSMLEPTVPEVSELNRDIAASLLAISAMFDGLVQKVDDFSEQFLLDWSGWFGCCDEVPDDFKEFLEDMVRHGLGFDFMLSRIPFVLKSASPWQSYVTLCRARLVASMYEALDNAYFCREAKRNMEAE